MHDDTEVTLKRNPCESDYGELMRKDKSAMHVLLQLTASSSNVSDCMLVSWWSLKSSLTWSGVSWLEMPHMGTKPAWNNQLKGQGAFTSHIFASLHDSYSASTSTTCVAVPHWECLQQAKQCLAHMLAS